MRTRVLYPLTGTTRADVVGYYTRVAPLLLPHVAGRPVALYRCPEGVEGAGFFQNRVPPHPPWLRTAVMPFGEAPVLGDVASLVWAANLSTVEIHPFLASANAPDTPLVMVFDLDPGPPAGMREACAVALRVRDALAADGLDAWPKSSGAKGVHVHVPVSGATYGATKSYARALAARLHGETPELVVDRTARSLRSGRVLVDWSQNDSGKSIVAPYSLRALRVPTVAMPVTWDEVAAGAHGDTDAVFFGMDAALKRVADLGDFFAPVLTTRQRLPG